MIEDDKVIELIQLILQKQGRPATAVLPDTELRAIQFRSLDFSELCLRVEQQTERELNFEAAALRRIDTVADVCQFLKSAAS